jgi:hypothetical protein
LAYFDQIVRFGQLARYDQSVSFALKEEKLLISAIYANTWQFVGTDIKEGFGSPNDFRA